MNRLEKKQLRRKMGIYTWALFLFYYIFNICVSYAGSFELVYYAFRSVIRNGDWNAFLSSIESNLVDVFYGNGWGYLLACLIAVLGIRIWQGKDFFRGIFHAERDLKGKDFCGLLCLMVSGQVVFQLVAIFEEWLLNMAGLSIMESLELASGTADTFSMFLYMVLGAPIAEELIFRGLVMRGLQPYGKRFAIFASAVLFALYHGNLVQTPYAFVVGLVLGIAAMEYSIGWAMLLHMINNLVLGDMYLRFTSWMDQDIAGMILWGIIYACSAISVVILIINGKRMRKYCKDNPLDRTNARQWRRTLPNVLYALLMLGNAIAMLYT